MAKTKVICPFSGKLCHECALYRGRHYFLCFCQTYRGYLEEPKDKKRRPGSNGKFEMPSLSTVAKDPFIDSL